MAYWPTPPFELDRERPREHDCNDVLQRFVGGNRSFVAEGELLSLLESSQQKEAPNNGNEKRSVATPLTRDLSI